jgi:hypothetical protein
MCGGAPAVRQPAEAAERQSQQQQRAAAKRSTDLAVPDDRAWIDPPPLRRPEVHCNCKCMDPAEQGKARVRSDIDRGRCTDARTRPACKDPIPIIGSGRRRCDRPVTTTTTTTTTELASDQLMQSLIHDMLVGTAGSTRTWYLWVQLMSC